MRLLPLVVLLLLLAPTAGPVAAKVVWKEDAALPHRWFASAWGQIGGYGYTLGNEYATNRSTILRIDLATLEVRDMGPKMPGFQRAHQASASTETHVYVFGGVDGGEAKDRTFRYDPVANHVSILPTKIPGGRDRGAAAYDPRVTAECPSGCIYLFGGRKYDSETQTYTVYDRVVRYDIASDAYTTLDARLPKPMWSVTAVFDGATIWLFGGQDERATSQYGIHAFDPLTATMRTSAALLPQPGYGFAAAWNGTAVLLAGGRNLPPYFKEILAFDPAAETVVDLGVQLPTGRWGAAAFPSGDGLLVVGGMQYTPGNVALRDIVHYDPHLAPPPVGLTATSGPGRGEITLAFDASPEAGVTGYEVALADGTPVATLATAGTFVDVGEEGVVRSYRVRSLNAHGAGPFGAVASAIAPGAPTAPTSPSTGRGPEPGDVIVAWKAPSFDGGAAVTAYRVYGGTSPDTATTLLGETTDLRFTQHGVPNGATRWYRVSAVNSAGEGPTTAAFSGSPPTAPGAPTRLEATPGLQSVHLKWGAPLSDGGARVTGYVVYRGEPGREVRVATVGDTRQWTDEDRAGFVTYSYRVAAVNGVGEGPVSVRASAHALGPGAYKIVLDGPVVVYQDADDDNVVDAGETVLVLPVLA